MNMNCSHSKISSVTQVYHISVLFPNIWDQAILQQIYHDTGVLGQNGSFEAEFFSMGNFRHTAFKAYGGVLLGPVWSATNSLVNVVKFAMDDWFN